MGKPPKKKPTCKHDRDKTDGLESAKREAPENSVVAPTNPHIHVPLPAETQQPTEEKEIRRIILGNYAIAAWYSSPYPVEYKQSQELYICERCLKYMQFRHSLESHTCPDPFPRGRLVYEDAGAALYEVDGKEHTLYCQNLCLLSKLFLDQKTIFYDIGGFFFYILLVRQNDRTTKHVANGSSWTKRQPEPCSYTFAGYFSKEKASIEQNNLACILVLPPFRGQNYGQLLIELSYELTKRDSTTGGPEQPLSSQGFHSYRSCWRRAIILALLGELQPAEQYIYECRYDLQEHGHGFEENQQFFSLSRLALLTGIRVDDVLFTLEDLGLLGFWLGRHVVCISHEILHRTVAEHRINLGMRMDPCGLAIDCKDDSFAKHNSSSDNDCSTDTSTEDSNAGTDLDDNSTESE